jgi:hypothetical protein
MSQANRAEWLEQFVMAGFVNGREQLDSLPDEEFQALCNALMPADPPARGAGEDPVGPQLLDSLPDQSIEERIRALKVPKGGINVNEALEQGRGLARDLIRQHNETTKSEILNSLIPTDRKSVV